MKKIKRRYLIFCILILTILVPVLFVKPDKEFLFDNAKGSCQKRSLFIYNALYKNTENPDIVFFGSSRTMNGINDSLLSADSKQKYLNLGYCMFGRNLDYFFAEEYCKNQKPKKIVFEIRGTEDNTSHKLTPFLLPVNIIAEGALSFQPDVFKDLYNKYLCNLKYIRSHLFNDSRSEIPKNNLEYGFWKTGKSLIIKDLNEKRFTDSVDLVGETKQEREMNANSKFYLEKLKHLCEKSKIDLYFLYLSSYGNLKKMPEHYETFKLYGKTLIAPDSIFCDPENFSDFSHFNTNGSNKISRWLITQF